MENTCRSWITACFGAGLLRSPSPSPCWSWRSAAKSGGWVFFSLFVFIVFSLLGPFLAVAESSPVCHNHPCPCPPDSSSNNCVQSCEPINGTASGCSPNCTVCVPYSAFNQSRIYTSGPTPPSRFPDPQATSSSSSSSSSKSSNPRVNMTALAGGVMGGLLAFGFIMAITVYIYYAHLKKEPTAAAAAAAAAGAAAQRRRHQHRQVPSDDPLGHRHHHHHHIQQQQQTVWTSRGTVDRSQAMPLYSRSNVVPVSGATASTAVSLGLYPLAEAPSGGGVTLQIYPITEGENKPPDRVVHVGYPLVDHRSFSIDASVASTADDYSCLLFSLLQLQVMTKRFSPDNLLGTGRYGNTYKGQLVDGATVVVKRITHTDGLAEGVDFIRQVEALAMADDSCLAKLWGCCVEANERVLMYEYIPMGSLETLLYGNKESYLKEASPPFQLGWLQRLRIATAIAKALDYLHRKKELGREGIVHGNLKPSNILMDEYMRPRLVDYGFAYLAIDNCGLNVAYHGQHKTEYQAPDYLHTGRIEQTSDVYSLGVILLELVSGKKPFGRASDRRRESITAMARRALKEDMATDFIDVGIEENSYDKISAANVIELALSCCNTSRISRPSLEHVVEQLNAMSQGSGKMAMVDSSTLLPTGEDSAVD